MGLGKEDAPQREDPQARSLHCVALTGANRLSSYGKAAALFADDMQANPKNLFPVRKLATVHSYIGETHEESARPLDGLECERHREAAKRNHRRAPEILSHLKLNNAPNEKDGEFFEKLPATAAKHEEEFGHASK